jgi:hypothetical protein
VLAHPRRVVRAWPLVPSLFIAAEIRDSGWFGSGTLAVLATYTVIVMGVPILMLYRFRIARPALTVVAALSHGGCHRSPNARTPVGVHFRHDRAGTDVAPTVQSVPAETNPHGNGAVL